MSEPQHSAEGVADFATQADAGRPPRLERNGAVAERRGDEEEAPPPGFAARWRLWLAARRDRLLAAAIATLERWRTPSRDDERDDRRQGTAKKEREAKHGDEAATPSPARSRLRPILLAGLLASASAVAGMSFSYRLLAQLVDEGGERWRRQQEQISAFGAAEKSRAAQAAELLGKLEKERNMRLAAEEGALLLEIKLMEMEAEDREPLLPESPRPSRRSGGAAPLPPEQASTFAPHGRLRAANECNLQGGNYGGRLKRCVEDFNRP